MKLKNNCGVVCLCLAAALLGCGTGDNAGIENEDGLTSEAEAAVVTALSKPWQPAAYIAPSAYNGTYLGVSGDYLNFPTPYWNLAQWAIPANLNPVYGPSSGWQSANSYGRFQYYAAESSGANVYELAQNGNTPALPCGTETDLFISPNDPGVYPGSPGAPDGFTASPPLNTLGAATMSVGLKVVYEQYNARCPLNYVAYDSALILTNSSANQIIYYQINLRNSQPNVYPDMWWCPDYETSSDGSFCLDDDVRIFGAAAVPANNTRVNTTINILPRLKQILATNHAKSVTGVKLDPDPSHWVIQNAYLDNALTLYRCSAIK